jgi:hypothetical protein
MNKPTPLKVSAPVRTCPETALEQIRGEENRRDLGEGLSSPPPSPKSAHLEIFQILRSGVDSLDLNDHGRPWPIPNRATIARLLAQHDTDLCLKAAREAKEIVQSQDRAPNISALFEKKVNDLAGVRSAVRESMEAA